MNGYCFTGKMSSQATLSRAQEETVESL